MEDKAKNERMLEEAVDQLAYIIFEQIINKYKDRKYEQQRKIQDK